MTTNRRERFIDLECGRATHDASQSERYWRSVLHSPEEYRELYDEAALPALQLVSIRGGLLRGA